MAKKWYPVIDILTCEECGACVTKCSHGVYDKSKAPIPVVVNPDNCIDHCHGCGCLLHPLLLRVRDATLPLPD